MLLDNAPNSNEKLNDGDKLNSSPTESDKNNTLKLFQPKLLKIKSGNSIGNNKFEQDKFFKSEKIKMKKKTENIEKYEVVSNNSNTEMEKKLLSFYKNPFLYLDYLIEKYFKEKFSEAEFTRIKENISKELNKNSNKSKDDIKSLFLKEMKEFQKSFKEEITEYFEKFRINQENVNLNYEKKSEISYEEKENLKIEMNQDKIKKLIEETISKKEVGKEILENQISQIEKENYPKSESSKQLISHSLTEAQEIKSEPIDHEEIYKKLFLTSKNSQNSKFHSIINKQTDIKNYLLNDNCSSLSTENILKKTLECLKGDKIQIPKRNFLEVKNLTINDMNLNQIVFTKNIIHKMRQFDSFKKQNEDEILKQFQNTCENEKKIFNNLIEKTNNSINQMENYKKISEDVINNLKEKLNTEFNENFIKMNLNKLKFHEKNLDLIKEDIIDVKQENIASIKERILFIEENNKKVNEEIEKLFAKNKEIEEKEKIENSIISDGVINELYKKFSKMKKKKNSLNLAKHSQKKVVRASTSMINCKYK